MRLSRPERSITWVPDGPARDTIRIGFGGWLRCIWRGAALFVLLILGFATLLVIAAVERVFCGTARPVTPWITQTVCVISCALLGLSRRVQGRPATGSVAHVANHVSWLDVFVLNASARVVFVAKSEVRSWPGIGWLARGTGTVFVARRRGAAKSQTEDVSDALRQGRRLLVFPEGTSTDGKRILNFKSTIFAAFFTDDAPPNLAIQPVILRYHAPKCRDARFYGWWAPHSFAESLLEVLAQGPQGSVEVIWGDPIAVAGHDRKSLAAESQAQVETTFSAKAP